MEIICEQSTKRIKFLDSLRGLSCLIIVIHHFLVFNGDTIKLLVLPFFFTFLSILSDLNTYAVLLFFVLSGISIGLSLKGRALNDRGVLNYYLYRRLKRILPIYVLALIVSGIIGVITQSLNDVDYSLKNLIGNLVFLQTPVSLTNYWFIPYGKNYPSWSLAYEWFFYMLFPIAYHVKNNLKNQNKYLTCMFVAIFSVTCLVINNFIPIPMLLFSSLFIIWYLGYLLSKEFYINYFTPLIWLSICFFSVGILLIREEIPSNTIIELFKGTLLASLIWGIIYRSKRRGGKSANVFENQFNKLFNFLGAGSYAIYMLHYPLLILLNYFHIHLTLQIFGVVLLIILSYFIELNINRYSFSFLKLNFVSLKK